MCISENFEDHLEHLENLSRKSNRKFRKRKFLPAGNAFSWAYIEGIRIDPDKVKAIHRFQKKILINKYLNIYLKKGTIF